MPEQTATLELITETDPMRREANEGLMVRWINRELLVRSNHDVRTSIVLYDKDRLFETALPAICENLLTPEAQQVLYQQGIRYWSRGIV